MVKGLVKHSGYTKQSWTPIRVKLRPDFWINKTLLLLSIQCMVPQTTGRLDALIINFRTWNFGRNLQVYVRLAKAVFVKLVLLKTSKTNALSMQIVAHLKWKLDLAV